jgi:hypothetical protein
MIVQMEIKYRLYIVLIFLIIHSKINNVKDGCYNVFQDCACNEQLDNCNGHGDCKQKENKNGYECKCDYGWKGLKCETPDNTPRVDVNAIIITQVLHKTNIIILIFIFKGSSK